MKVVRREYLRRAKICLWERSWYCLIFISCINALWILCPDGTVETVAELTNFFGIVSSHAKCVRMVASGEINICKLLLYVPDLARTHVYSTSDSIYFDRRK